MILVTGAAGFIGFHLTVALLSRGENVLGIDNLNDYYDPDLKVERLTEISKHPRAKNFTFIELDIADRPAMSSLFSEHNSEIVVNLAAQAGVRFSLENPHSYVNSNLTGFLNVLEGCRHAEVKHLVYASSSSVYGMNVKQPFSTEDRVDYPVSLYAATKKSNELMAHTYSHLYKIPTTGLRFFTVYGPYGRPDMAYYKFTKAILNGDPIDVYNNGEMKRDFTYIDDIVDGVIRVMEQVPSMQVSPYSAIEAPYRLFNIGNNKPESLEIFISAIEDACNRKAVKNFMPMQPGDVLTTYADIDDLKKTFNFQPDTPIEEGIRKFVSWYIAKHDIKV